MKCRSKNKKDFPNAVAVSKFSDSNIRREKNVVYYSLGERELHADLFYPAKKVGNRIPAVILIHGGGWASGNKSHLVPMAQKLAENGFFAASFEQRLSPEAKYPAAITDFKTAIKWVKINDEKYGNDTAKIAVLGCSSGATVATLLGTTGQNPKVKSVVPSVVQEKKSAGFLFALVESPIVKIVNGFSMD